MRSSESNQPIHSASEGDDDSCPPASAGTCITASASTQQVKSLPPESPLTPPGPRRENAKAQALFELFRGTGSTDGARLSPEEARRWALVAQYTGDVSRGVAQAEFMAFYGSFRPQKLQRDMELALWHAEAEEAEQTHPTWPEPVRDCCLKAFVKKHSIVRDIFFRPPKPDYDETQKDLVFLPLQHTKQALPCLWLPHPESSRVLIFTHSNACDISQNPVVYSYRHTFGVSVLAPEWPGYGLASGTPTETMLTYTLLDVILYVNTHLKVPIGSIILWGRSLATGPCVFAAALLEAQGFRVGGVVLKSPYLSWKKVLAEVGPDKSTVRTLGTIVSKLIFDRFKVYSAIKTVTAPLLLIHGMLDQVIPYTHSAQLYGLAATPPDAKVLLLVETGDHDCGIERWESTKKFIAGLHTPNCSVLRTLPAECYDVHRLCAAAWAARSKAKRLRLLRWAAVAVLGLLSIATGIVFTANDGCALPLRVWLFLHGVTVVWAAAVYATADWVQDNLSRARDPTVQQRSLASLVGLIVLWVADLVVGHVALFGTSSCSGEGWWISFALMAALNYVYILQALITNK